MQISVASLITCLLVLQSNPNNAFVPSASTSVNIEDYANDFLSNLKQLTTVSKDSAENVSKVVYELSQNITRNIQQWRNIESTSIPHNVLESLTALESHLSITSKQLEEGFERYKNVTQGEVGSKKAHVAFAEQITTEFNWGGLSQVPHIINMDFLDRITKVNSLCNMRESQQQSFNNLLKNIQYATAQSYATIDIAYELLKRFGDKTGNLDYISNIRSNVLNVYRSSANIFKTHLDNLSRDYYACDSTTLMGDDSNSFIILKPFQKYLFTEDQISPGFSGATDSCNKRCTAVNEMTNPIVCKESSYDDHEYNSNDKLCKLVRRCSKVYCPKHDDRHYGKYELCVNPPHSIDRYQFYFPRGQSNGKQCTKFKQILSASTRGHRHLTGSDRNKFCSICDCTCLDNDYYISTEPTYTNFDDHMVVVGAKFLLLKKTLYIQLRQAKLLLNGEIDASTVSWKPINQNESNRVKLDWQDLRTIDLSDNILPAGKTLIGLKFEKVNDPDENLNVKKHHVALSIYSSLYDFAKGQLKGNRKWHSSKVSKKELKLSGDNRPTRNSDNRLLSTKDEYLVFSTTSSVSDGGQNTIPFIDSREVVPQTLTPLSGAGLVYMAQKGSGGYIELKLTTYDVAPHINTE